LNMIDIKCHIIVCYMHRNFEVLATMLYCHRYLLQFIGSEPIDE